MNILLQSSPIQKAQDVLNKNNFLIFYILSSISFVPASPAVSAGIIVAFCVHPRHLQLPSLCLAISYSNLYILYIPIMFLLRDIFCCSDLWLCCKFEKSTKFVDIYRITAVWRLRQTMPRIASSQIGGDYVFSVIIWLWTWQWFCSTLDRIGTHIFDALRSI